MQAHLTLLATIAALAGLSACTVRTTADTPAYPPVYSQAAPAYAAPGYAYGAPAAVQPYDSYCAEAVGEAQAAAAEAARSGTQLATDRARRSFVGAVITTTLSKRASPPVS